MLGCGIGTYVPLLMTQSVTNTVQVEILNFEIMTNYIKGNFREI